MHAWEAWGEDCVQALSRHVRLRAVGPQPADAVHGARPAGRQADVLRAARRRHAAVRLRAEVAAGLHGGVLRATSTRWRSRSTSRSATWPSRARIFRQAQKLPPAHMLTHPPRPARCREPKEYWDVRFTLDNPISVDDACAELCERLRESVKLRLISEVPLGAFLSGGVDSSAVVATMAGLSDEPVNTCSIAFDDPKFNESEFAQTVADRYRTNHHVETVHSDDFDLIDTLARLYDEPYADSSAIPTYRVCQLARKHVTVALSGDGGDETFGGYRRYRLHLMEERMRSALPAAMRQPLFGLLGRVYPKADWAPRVFRAKTTFEGMARNVGRGLLPFGVDPARADARAAVQQRLQARTGRLQRAARCSTAMPARAGTDDPLALIQYLDLKTYLVGDINTKVDRASMAHSLEVREPLMDHQLVEWLATLPSNAEGARPGRQVPAEEGDGAAAAERRAVPAEDGLLRCRWRAGSAGR